MARQSWEPLVWCYLATAPRGGEAVDVSESLVSHFVSVPVYVQYTVHTAQTRATLSFSFQRVFESLLKTSAATTVSITSVRAQGIQLLCSSYKKKHSPLSLPVKTQLGLFLVTHPSPPKCSNTHKLSTQHSGGFVLLLLVEKMLGTTKKKEKKKIFPFLQLFKSAFRQQLLTVCLQLLV